MGKYFGTDGFRGEANKELTADHAYRVGRFLGWYYGECKRRNGDHSRPRIVIGKDTRRSSYMFEYSLVGGLTASGADAYLLHVTTTPSVACRLNRVFQRFLRISVMYFKFHDNRRQMTCAVHLRNHHDIIPAKSALPVRPHIVIFRLFCNQSQYKAMVKSFRLCLFRRFSSNIEIAERSKRYFVHIIIHCLSVI